MSVLIIAKNMHEACATIHCAPHKHTEREHGYGCGEQRFLNKNERTEMLEEHREKLKRELKGIEEELKKLKEDGGTMKHINLTELLEFSHLHHIKKDIIRTAGFNAVLICLEKDQEIPPHPEPYYVLFHILEGEGIITAGSELYHVKDGHMVYVESNDIRGIKCIERMSIIGVQQPH